MDENEIHLVEASFRAIGGRGEAFITRFYQLFFAKSPKAEKLFGETDLHAQTRKMLLTIMMVVDTLRDSDHIAEMLHKTHLVHKKYELSAEDFEPLNAAMIEAFSEFLGDTWTEDHALAWRKALEKVTDLMLAPVG